MLIIFCILNGWSGPYIILCAEITENWYKIWRPKFYQEMTLS